MKAGAAIAAWIRRHTAAAVAPATRPGSRDSSALEAWDALNAQVEEQLVAWSMTKNATGRAVALLAAAGCRDQQAATASAAFKGAMSSSAIPGVVQDVRLSAVLLRLVALTEDADLIKPGADGKPALDAEALEIQLVEAAWLDYSDQLETRLVETLEPHLYQLAALRWNLQVGPRSRRYAAALTELAEAVDELSRDSEPAERWSLEATSIWANALSRHATEQADRP